MLGPRQTRRRGAVPDLGRGGDDGHEVVGGLGRIRVDDAAPRPAPRAARRAGGIIEGGRVLPKRKTTGLGGRRLGSGGAEWGGTRYGEHKAQLPDQRSLTLTRLVHGIAAHCPPGCSLPLPPRATSVFRATSLRSVLTKVPPFACAAPAQSAVHPGGASTSQDGHMYGNDNAQASWDARRGPPSSPNSLACRSRRPEKCRGKRF